MCLKFCFGELKAFPWYSEAYTIVAKLQYISDSVQFAFLPQIASLFIVVART